MNGDKHYHGEIHIHIGPNEARINVFSDTLEELFRDLGTIQGQWGMPDPITNPAKRAIVNAEGIAAKIPVCPNCGQRDQMELIEFPDNKTGEMRKAWKCQRCNKWYWPPKGKSK